MFIRLERQPALCIFFIGHIYFFKGICIFFCSTKPFFCIKRGKGTNPGALKYVAMAAGSRASSERSLCKASSARDVRQPCSVSRECDGASAASHTGEGGGPTQDSKLSFGVITAQIHRREMYLREGKAKELTWRSSSQQRVDTGAMHPPRLCRESLLARPAKNNH